MTSVTNATPACGERRLKESEMDSYRSPMFSDVGVLALVPDKWNSLWQPRHQVLSRMNRYFHVVWVDPPQGWRERWLNRPGSNRSHTSSQPEPVVYETEWWLPKFYRPRWLGEWTARQGLRRARNILVSKGSRKIILYVWRPEFAATLDRVVHDVSCYHIDDEYSFSPVDTPLDPVEADLIRRADLVYIHSPGLLEKKGSLNPRTVFVPNGVDYEAYATAKPEPSDLASIPHPRIGYVGVIKRQLDLSLLAALAEQHPEWSFVFVGPYGHVGPEANMEKMFHMKNVFFLGTKPVEELPCYTQHMDVCLMCYLVNDYTNHIYPLKLHEYLASGRPVVSAPIRSVLEFADVLTFASTKEEWSKAIGTALTSEHCAVEQVDKRRRVARGYDWEPLVQRIAGSMCNRLGPSYADRFREMVARQ